MSVQITRIDDQDPSITYSSNNWILGGNGNEYMGTTMRTVTLGASMKIAFTGESKFTLLYGTKVAVFGSLGPESIYGKAPTSLFSIDGGRAQQFVGTQAENDSLYQQKFYESPDLTPGPHILLVTISDVPSLTSAFIVDYADITNSGTTSPASESSSSPSAPTPSPSITLKAPTSSSPFPSATSSPHSLSGPSISPPPSSSSASSLSVAGQNTTGFSSPTSGSASLSQGSTSSATDGAMHTFVPQNDTVSARAKINTPIIAGAIVGCIVFLLLLLLGLWLYLRRRKVKQLSEKVESAIHEFPMPVSPPVSTTESGMWTGSPTEYNSSLSYLSSSALGSVSQAQVAHPPISKSDEARRGRELEEDPPSYDALNL